MAFPCIAAGAYNRFRACAPFMPYDHFAVWQLSDVHDGGSVQRGWVTQMLFRPASVGDGLSRALFTRDYGHSVGRRI